MDKKYLWISGGVIITIAFLGWLFWASTRPLPGTKLSDLGREHIEIGKEATYNSNPPTSGSHYVDWVRAGIYTEEKDDRNLVHSLEHGYVIVSYNCDFQVSTPIKSGSSFKFQVSEVSAHGLEEKAIGNEASTGSGSLSEAFKSDECHTLVDQLISVYEKKGKKKIIVIPRPSLDSKIALTAWGYLDKFNSFDGSRIEKFIDAHINNGPERTME